MKIMRERRGSRHAGSVPVAAHREAAVRGRQALVRRTLLRLPKRQGSVWPLSPNFHAPRGSEG